MANSGPVKMERSIPATYTPKMAHYGNAASDLVEQRFNASKELAERLMEETTNQLQALTSLWQDYNIPALGLATPKFTMGTVNDPGRLAILPRTTPETTFSSPPELAAVVLGDLPPIPAFTAVAPTVTIPESPVVVYPADPGNPPIFVEPPAITPVQYVEPSMPVMKDVVIPPAPADGILPVFAGIRPSTQLSVPSSTFGWSENAYDSALMQTLKSLIREELINGGTGLGPVVEADLWERMKDRRQDEWNRLYDEASNINSGFELPTGMFIARLDEINAGHARDIVRDSQEIAIKQAELALANQHFMVEKGIALETILIEENNNRQNRTFEAAKYTFEASLKMFELQKAKLEAETALYVADAQVYKSLMDAVTIVIEKYKAQLEAAKLVNDINTGQVQLYIAAWEGVKAKLDAYKTQVSVNAMLVDLEKTKQQAFMTQVEVYKAKMEAITTRFNAWQAQITGESLKVDIYGKQAQAYASQMEGVRTAAQYVQVRASAISDANKNLISRYAAELEGQKAKADALAKSITSLVQSDSVAVDAYKGYVSFLAVLQSAEAEAFKARMQEFINENTILLEQLKLEVSLKLEQARNTVDANKSAASTEAHIAAAALSMIGTQAHISMQTQDSLSEAVSTQLAMHRSEGYQESNSMATQQTI